MYRGYHILDIFKYNEESSTAKEEVSSSYTLSFATAPVKRFRTAISSTKGTVGIHHELQSALGNLVSAVANMKEFLVAPMTCIFTSTTSWLAVKLKCSKLSICSCKILTLLLVHPFFPSSVVAESVRKLGSAESVRKLGSCIYATTIGYGPASLQHCT